MVRSLLLGCGSSRMRHFRLPGDPQNPLDWGGELVTLDNNRDHNPDVVYDLEDIGFVKARGMMPGMPFDDNDFDRIDAYEVLEHVGRQGDYHTLFRQFTEFWRILKPGGHFCATTPSYRSPWAWGDPSHTRVFTSGTLVFLNQEEYKRQVGKTAMSDFRHVYRADFDIVSVDETDDHLRFVLQAVKPSRWAAR